MPPHVLVTGGLGGIGASTGATLSERGWAVSVLDRSAPPGVPSIYACDVTDAEATKATVRAAVAALGPLDALVVCAGIDPSRDATADLDVGIWAAVLAVNLTGAFHAVRAAVPKLVDGGAVVLCGSVLGRVGIPGTSAYSASKAGLEGLTRVLALELAPRRIRVNCVEPGGVRTPMLARTLADSGMEMEGYGADRLVGRPLTSEDVAVVIAFLAGDEAAGMTGAIVPVDTGLSAAAALPSVLRRA